MKFNIIIVIFIVLVMITGLGYLLFGLKERADPEFHSPQPLNSPYSSILNMPSVSPLATSSAGVPESGNNTTIFLISTDDGGNIGCGDSLVAVTRKIEGAQNSPEVALKELLLIKEKRYGKSGLYDALADSSLQIEKIDIKDGNAAVYLEGDLRLGGVCDNPRIEAQLTETLAQFDYIKSAEFFVNNEKLKLVLSGQ